MIIEEIKKDLLSYQKEKRPAEVSALRMLISALVNKEKDKRALISEELTEEELSCRAKLTDEEIIQVISSEAKKRKDSIESFKSGGREDLAENEMGELKAIEKYLPEAMPEEEVRRIVGEVIKEKNISDIKEIGIVMKEAIARTKGRADGAIINKIVRESLK